MSAPTAAPASDADVREIRTAGERWLAAVGDRDGDRVAACYAADGAFMVPNAPLAQGRDAIRGVWMQLLAAPDLSLDWTPATIQVAGSGDLAYELGSYRLAMDGAAGRVEDDGKYVVVWRKGPRGWKVAADIFNSSRPLPAPGDGGAG